MNQKDRNRETESGETSVEELDYSDRRVSSRGQKQRNSSWETEIQYDGNMKTHERDRIGKERQEAGKKIQTQKDSSSKTEKKRQQQNHRRQTESKTEEW